MDRTPRGPSRQGGAVPIAVLTAPDPIRVRLAKAVTEADIPRRALRIAGSVQREGLRTVLGGRVKYCLGSDVLDFFKAIGRQQERLAHRQTRGDGDNGEGAS